MGSGLKGQRLIALFLLGCLLLNYPRFSRFAGPIYFVGIPLIYIAVFFVWALLIALMALTVERRGD